MQPAAHDDAVPMTVLLPEGATAPIELYHGGAALRMAVVERAGVAALVQPDWDKPGVYVLLDLPAPDGTCGCYAGQASAPCTRLVQPVGRPPWRGPEGHAAARPDVLVGAAAASGARTTARAAAPGAIDRPPPAPPPPALPPHRPRFVST